MALCFSAESVLFALAFSQYKDVLSTFLGCLFVRLCTLDPADRLKFIRLCIYTVAIGSAIKVYIFIYCYLDGISVSDFVDRISSIFGVKLMSMDIDGVGGRLQFPSDNVLPICVFALMSQRKHLRVGPWTSFLVTALFVVSTIDTFSRYIWASTLLAALLGMLVSRRDRMHWVYIGLAALTIAIFLRNVIELVELRFFSPLASESDLQRVGQIASLKRFFWGSPFFGHGMGSFPLDYTRSSEVPYAYEVQILALCGEFGLVGMGLFFCLLVDYYRKAFTFSEGTLTYRLCVFAILLDFLAAGFFNPCLLVSLSALCYGLIFALAGSPAFVPGLEPHRICQRTGRQGACVSGSPSDASGMGLREGLPSKAANLGY